MQSGSPAAQFIHDDDDDDYHDGAGDGADDDENHDSDQTHFSQVHSKWVI